MRENMLQPIRVGGGDDIKICTYSMHTLYEALHRTCTLNVKQESSLITVNTSWQITGIRLNHQSLMNH